MSRLTILPDINYPFYDFLANANPAPMLINKLPTTLPKYFDKVVLLNKSFIKFALIV